MKILLADDEKWVRATIKSVLPVDELSLVVVGEASNGLEALELALALTPDILLTDIKMPGLNGIELIKELKQHLPHLKTIIISGYDDFEYTQKAIQLGAFDYLLKPIDEQNITEVLLKTKEAIFQERERIEQQEFLRKQHEKSLPLLRENFLNRVIHENMYTYDDIKKQLTEFNIELRTCVFRVMTISIDDYVTKIKNLSERKKQQILSKFNTHLYRIIKRYFNGITFFSHDTENELIGLYNPQKEISLDQIYRILKNTQKIISRRLNITFSVGISAEGLQNHTLNGLYLQSKNALKFKMITGKNSIHYFENLNVLKIKEFHFSSHLVNEIILNMELLNEDNVVTIINSLFEQVQHYEHTTPEIIKTAFWKLLLEIVNGLNCKTFSAVQLYTFTDSSVYEQFKKLDTLEEMNEYIIRFLSDISNNHIKEEKPTHEKVVESAKYYIDHNYNKDITLELISNYVYVNPTYFSELFKKETGQNFIEYITNLRIEKAKELLKNTNLKIYEICESIGYTDSKYFSKLFKRIVGFTPSEYKKNM